jgi:hypothetical protein
VPRFASAVRTLTRDSQRPPHSRYLTCAAHESMLEADVKNDSSPQCPRCNASQAESPRRNGRQIAIGLPAGRDQIDCGTAHARRTSATRPSKNSGCCRNRHRPPGKRGTRIAVTVLDAFAGADSCALALNRTSHTESTCDPSPAISADHGWL